jgi:hypothetical protein
MKTMACWRFSDRFFVLIWHESGSIFTSRRFGAMTLEQVRSKTERIREFSALPFLLVAAVSLLGAIYRPAPQIVTGGAINPGDVAWMLTATGLVLLMTLACRSSTGEWFAPRTSSRRCCRALWRWR